MRIPSYCLFSSILFLACGSASSTPQAEATGGACLDDGFDSCGEDCVADGDCAIGVHCTEVGICSSECSGDEECGSDETCSTKGQCTTIVEGKSDEFPDCPSAMLDLDPLRPTVILLIDRSGSMDGSFDDPDGNASNRWDEVHRALTDADTGVVTELEDSVLFGASLYSSEGGYGNDPENPKTCPILQTAAAGLGARDDIDTLLADNFPISNADTPTAESLEATFANFPDGESEDSPRVLVLATDGDPDSCEEPGANGDDEPREASEDAVVAGHALGIDTFVISVGTAVTESHLHRLANAGVGQDLDTGDAEPFIASDASAVTDAFETIIRQSRSCKFPLDGKVTDVTTGTVRMNGKKLEHGTDWILLNPSKIRLVGQACQDLKASAEATIEAEFACGGFSID